MRGVTSLVAALFLTACPGGITSGTGGGAGGGGGGTGFDAGPLCDAPSDDAGTFDDQLPPTRLLRRASMVLRGVPPTDAEYAQLLAAGDDTAQRAFVTVFIDQRLAAPDFYQSVFEFSRDWFNVPLAPPTADEPEYGPQQQRSIQKCAMTTPNGGKFAYVREDYEGGMMAICGGTTRDGGVPKERSLEPWWAPGTQVTLVGSAASEDPSGVVNINGNWNTVPCNGRPDGTCGCGPNGVNCHADLQQYPGWENYVFWNEHGQRRQLSEEPARLFAHLVWHDKPLTDLVLSSTSVGTTRTISAYVMQGAESGDLTQLTDDSWWQPAKYSSAAVDPLHTAGDPEAWREFDVPTVSRVFIGDRDYKYDPRTTSTPMTGVPAAGMLTSIGFLTAQPRERLRAARMLEALACEVLAPPSGQVFNPYVSDPATEGPCQHCHRRIDPAAIHFKRFAKAGSAFEGWGANYFMPAVGGWHWPAQWRTKVYPYSGEPFSHWNRWYAAGTRLTPVTQAQVDADPMVVFIDFLPPDQTLLGQVSDGTVGPLGFGKLIVASGSFDRCMVRHLHQFVLGRDIDPAKETGYLDLLTAKFVADGRKARPFIKTLLASDLFGRGL
ncbi:MAG: hypothetical protein U0228_03040 [Myxococcaceae bacterium]